jgi:hypothetical protein
MVSHKQLSSAVRASKRIFEDMSSILVLHFCEMLDLAPAGYETFSVLEDKPPSPDGGGLLWPSLKTCSFYSSVLRLLGSNPYSGRCSVDHSRHSPSMSRVSEYHMI